MTKQSSQLSDALKKEAVHSVEVAKLKVVIKQHKGELKRKSDILSGKSKQISTVHEEQQIRILKEQTKSQGKTIKERDAYIKTSPPNTMLQ